MKTWHVYGALDADKEPELLGAVLASNMFDALDLVDERFEGYCIHEVTLEGHGMSAPTVTQAH